MADARELKLKIDAFNPNTMPMARLAEYMSELAALLGEPTMVHFVRLEGGSTVIVHMVEEEAVPKVEERVEQVRHGCGPTEAIFAFKAINRKLREDNGTAVLLRDEGAEIIKFPGREVEKQVTFGAFNQEGSIDGVLIRLGGTRDLVPVNLQEGDVYYNCLASRSIAKRLGVHLFTSELRVHGTGRWYRDEEGAWVLVRFTIADFEVLDAAPLSEVVKALRAVKGSGWETLPDPWSELQKIRNGRDGMQ